MTHECYMGRPHELSKHPDANRTFEEIAKAAPDRAYQRHVFDALWSFWNFEHALDDVLDAGHLDAALREDLLRRCYEFINEALMSEPKESRGDAAIWFDAGYSEAIATAGFAERQQELATLAFMEFAGNLAANPFYRRHARQHLAMFQSMIFRALAGDEMASSLDRRVQALAPAVRCGDVDFIVHVARLVGGWALARKISSERDYDLD